MMVQGVSISEMLNQSTAVLTSPSVTTFERFERLGRQREALTYVGVAAAITALASLVGNLGNGIIVALFAGIIGGVAAVALYFVFAYVLFWIGKQQSGTGTQDEVFYTTSLYVAPILAVNGIIGGLVALIPFLGFLTWIVTLALGIYQIYLAYLASRASMNLDQNKAIISVLVAFAAQFVVSLIIGFITAAIVLGGAAASGALS